MSKPSLPEPPRKSFYLLLLSASMILPASALFTATSDLPHVFLLTVLGLGLSFLLRKPFPYNDRTVIYSILTALVLAFLFDFLIGMDRDRFSISGDLFVARISGPAMIYLAVMATFFESGPYTLGISACFALTVTMLGGDVYGRVIVNPRMPFLNPLMAQVYVFFCCVAIWEMLALVFSFTALRKAEKNASSQAASRSLWHGRGIRLLALLLAPLLAFSLLSVFNSLEHHIRKLESKIISAAIKRARANSNIVFSREVDLNRTISDEVKDAADRIVLRAMSSAAPGYLRGRVYTTYSSGRWECPDKEASNLKFRSHGDILSYKTFFISEENSGNFRVHILPASGFTTDVLLLPGSCNTFEIVADRVFLKRQGVYTPEEWQKDGGYTALFPSAKNCDAAFPLPSEEIPETALLAVPETIKDSLDKALAEALGPDYRTRKQSSAEKVRGLLEFFSDKFKYSLEGKQLRGEDPVAHFLLNDREGHCELFASSMTLMLRELGIPARYVTGFICEEQHPAGQYYVARVGNAHAWLEAYLPETGGWTRLEPTPPSGIPNFRHEWSSWESWIDRLKQALQQALSDMRRGHFAEGVIALVGNLFSFLSDLLWDPVRGIFALIVLGLVFFFWRLKRKRIVRHDDLPPATLALQREFERMEGFVRKRYGLVREPSVTPREWSLELGRTALVPQEFIGWFTDYETLRYRTPGPSQEESKGLILRARLLRRSKRLPV